jgi:hypothetical protein
LELKNRFIVAQRKRSMHCLTLPFFQELENAQSILLAGAGGGFDIFSGLPLYFGLRNLGKQVHLANLSFSPLSTATGRRLSSALMEVTADTQGKSLYFPEKYLAQWFVAQGEHIPIYFFERTGGSTATDCLPNPCRPFARRHNHFN